MKRCPTCNRTYADESISFCLSDGALLSAPFDSEATVSFGDHQLPTAQPYLVQDTTAPPSSPNRALLIVAALLATAILGGVATWAMIGQSPAVVSNSSSAPPMVNNSAPAPATDSANGTTPGSVNEPSAPGPPAINAQATAALDEWFRTLLANDLEGHLKLYADFLSVYFTKRNVSFAFVRQSMTGWFREWTVLKMSRTNLQIEIDPVTGEVTTSFDADYENRTNNRSQAGKAQTQLRWKRIEGEWRVTSERNPCEYYRSSGKIAHPCGG